MTNLNDPEPEYINRTQILSVLALAAVILLVVAIIWQYLARIEILAWKITLPAIIASLGITAIIILVSSFTYRFWPEFRHNVNSYLKLIIDPLVWADLIWVGLLPGLSEELLFRGVMLPALGLNWLALVISSVIFGVVHISSLQQWPYAFHATLFGLLLGYGALVTHNLMVPMLAHILTNLISAIMWKTGKFQSFSPPS